MATNDYLDFLSQNVPGPEKPAATPESAGTVSVTIKVDADCYLMCDGEFAEVELKANVTTKVTLPVGQHLLEFVNPETSETIAEKEVDYPVAGKSYLLIMKDMMKSIQEDGISKFKEAIKERLDDDRRIDTQEAAELEEIRKKIGLDSESAMKLISDARRQVRKESVVSNADVSYYADILRNAIIAYDETKIRTIWPDLGVVITSNVQETPDVLSTRCLYYLTLAALNPQKLIDLQESAITDDYWRAYWSFIAYSKGKNRAQAANILTDLQDIYVDFPKGNIILLRAIDAMNNLGREESLKCLNSVKNDFSQELRVLFNAIKVELEIDNNLSDKEQTACAFIQDNVVSFEDKEIREKRRKEKEARRKAEAEEEARRKAKAEEEARRKAEAEEEARRKAEAEEEARRKAKAEEEARRKAEAEEEARRKAEAEEEARRKAKAEEEARRKAEAEEEARRKAEAEEEARRKAKAEEEMQKAGIIACGAIGDPNLDDIHWSLSSEYILRISGRGRMLDKSDLEWSPYNADIKKVVIEESITNIGESAFSNLTHVTSISIPNTVESIGDSAFDRCKGLTSITIPSSVTLIGNSAFWNCTGLTSITIPSSVTSIEISAFEDCYGLTSITIPNSVTSIEFYAFRCCTGLTSITIPSSVTLIKSEAFKGCDHLEEVHFKKVEHIFELRISDDAFGSSEQIKRIKFYAPAQAIKEYRKLDIFKGGIFSAPKIKLIPE